jgi:hypothetical protein
MHETVREVVRLEDGRCEVGSVRRYTTEAIGPKTHRERVRRACHCHLCACAVPPGTRGPAITVAPRPNLTSP